MTRPTKRRAFQIAALTIAGAIGASLTACGPDPAQFGGGGGIPAGAHVTGGSFTSGQNHGWNAGINQ